MSKELRGWERGGEIYSKPMGEQKCPISEVSYFQGIKCMQELFLGKQKVSLLEHCPYFRGFLREGPMVLFKKAAGIPASTESCLVTSSLDDCSCSRSFGLHVRGEERGTQTCSGEQ